MKRRAALLTGFFSGIFLSAPLMALDFPCPIDDVAHDTAPSSIYEISVALGDDSEIMYTVQLDAEYQSTPIDAVYIRKTNGKDLLLTAPLAVSSKSTGFVETFFLVTESEMVTGYALILVYAKPNQLCPDADAKVLVLNLPA